MDAKKREEPDRPPELRDTMVDIREALYQIRDVLEELGGGVIAIATELERMRQEK